MIQIIERWGNSSHYYKNIFTNFCLIMMFYHSCEGGNGNCITQKESYSLQKSALFVYIVEAYVPFFLWLLLPSSREHICAEEMGVNISSSKKFCNLDGLHD